MKNIIYLLFALLISFCTTVFCADATDILMGRNGSRALGLGGAYVSLSDDASAPFWNPAGLAKSKGWDIASNYTNQYDEVSRISLSTAYPLGDNAVDWLNHATLGLTVLQESISDIPLTTSTNAYGDGDRIGSYSDTQLAMALSYVKPLSETILLGATGKYYTHSHSVYSASGFGVDVGMMWQALPDLQWGGVWKNLLQPTLEWNTPDKQKDSLPMALITGVNYKTRLLEKMVIVAGDVDLFNSSLRVGVESEVIDHFTLRIGKSTSEWTLGCGVAWQGFSVDYAYTAPNDLGSEQHLTLKMNIPTNKTTSEKTVAKKENVTISEQSIESAVVTTMAVSSPTPHEIVSTPQEMVVTSSLTKAVPLPVLTLSLPERTHNQKMGISGVTQYTEKLWINDTPVRLRKDYKFYEEIPLKLGSNDLVFKAVNEEGKEIEIKRSIVRE